MFSKRKKNEMGRDRTEHQLEAEVNLLSRRMLRGPQRNGAGWIGKSSDALVAMALADKPEPGENERLLGRRPSEPHDIGDLVRCFNTYLEAPRHLQPTMAVVLRRWSVQVLDEVIERDEKRAAAVVRNQEEEADE